MDRSAIDSLSERERQCLRLVPVLHSSKAIGRALGISPETVSHHIKRGRAKIGASTRVEAAQMLLAHESHLSNGDAALSPAAGYPPATPLAALPDPAIMATPNAGGWRARAKALLAWIPSIGGERHDFNATETIIAILKVSMLTTGVLAALIATGYWLNHLLL